MAKQSDISASSPLRIIGKQLGILGTDPTPGFEFISKADTGLRNEAINAGVGSSNNVSLSDVELQQQIAQRLRTSGPATFRNLRDVIGTTGVKNLQEQFGLTNVPTNILSQDQIKTPGKNISFTGPEGNTLTGVRKSLEQSLKPETMQQTVRRQVIGKTKKDALKSEIETQLLEAETAKAQGSQAPNMLERIAGVGSTFLENLFKPKEAKPVPTTKMTIPETGEEIDFSKDIEMQIAQLEADAQAAIQGGADANAVNRRLTELIAQLQKGRK